jgi:hypothetical protein
MEVLSIMKYDKLLGYGNLWIPDQFKKNHSNIIILNYTISIKNKINVIFL